MSSPAAEKGGTTNEAKARAVLDFWHDNKAGTELPRLDRESLIAAFTIALDQARQEVWNEINKYIRNYHHNIVVGKYATKAIVDIEDWCRQQAQSGGRERG